MNKEDEVSLFLKRFKDKAKIFGIIFRDDRGKNTQALLDLEITALKRLEIIKNLEVDDFVEGPLEDTLNKVADLWVFGKKVKSQDVYIKISMGIANNSAVCISFHVAELNWFINSNKRRNDEKSIYRRKCSTAFGETNSSFQKRKVRIHFS